MKQPQKSAWFYIAIIVGMSLLFTVLFFMMTFIYSAITGNTEILDKVFGLTIPLLR